MVASMRLPPQWIPPSYNGSGDQNVNAAVIKNIGKSFNWCDSLNLRLARMPVRRRFRRQTDGSEV
jgi:hypothetical protein